MNTSIRECQKCHLCKNQPPLVDENISKKYIDVFWVGLSAVKVEDIENSTPLSKETKTGYLVSTIEEVCKQVAHYRTNLVKCLPLRNKKIRYPTAKEMDICFGHLDNEILFFKPKVIFLLGRQVAEFILNRNGYKMQKLHSNFEYETYDINGHFYVPIHHPSYILIYKRKLVDKYIENVSNNAINLTRNSSANFVVDSSW